MGEWPYLLGSEEVEGHTRADGDCQGDRVARGERRAHEIRHFAQFRQQRSESTAACVQARSRDRP